MGREGRSGRDGGDALPSRRSDSGCDAVRSTLRSCCFSAVGSVGGPFRRPGEGSDGGRVSSTKEPTRKADSRSFVPSAESKKKAGGEKSPNHSHVSIYKEPSDISEGRPVSSSSGRLFVGWSGRQRLDPFKELNLNHHQAPLPRSSARNLSSPLSIGQESDLPVEVSCRIIVPI